MVCSNYEGKSSAILYKVKCTKRILQQIPEKVNAQIKQG